jgi:hypothetical protein
MALRRATRSPHRIITGPPSAPGAQSSHHSEPCSEFRQELLVSPMTNVL